MQEEEGKTPEEDKGTEESEKVKDVFCLSQRRLEVLIYFELDIFFTCSSRNSWREEGTHGKKKKPNV
jgi:hypothetical protein